MFLTSSMVEQPIVYVCDFEAIIAWESNQEFNGMYSLL